MSAVAPSLAGLFAALFRTAEDPGGLRAWLGGWALAGKIEEEIPGLLASSALLTHEVELALERRGLVGPELYARLIATFPQEEARIRGVAREAGSEPTAEQVAAQAGVRPPVVAAKVVAAADLSSIEAVDSARIGDWIARRRPLLWVGAGVSEGAGMPSSAALIAAMVADDGGETADAAGWPRLSLFEAAERFQRHQSRAALQALLQREIGQRRGRLTPTLRGLARLARTGAFRAILTTSYDDLLERALHEAGVPYVLRGPDANEGLRPEKGAIELIKLHGGYQSWERAVLSTSSYAEFHARYPYWPSELDTLLRKEPVLFVGCSMTDPRVLTWLCDRPEGWQLQPWRALLTRKTWARLCTETWERGAVSGALAKSSLRPVLIDDHGQLDRIFGALGPDDPEDLRVDLDLRVQAGGWRVSSRQLGTWTARDPREIVGFEQQLKALDRAISLALPVDDRGGLAPAAAGLAAAARAVAIGVGEALTTSLLPGDLPERLARLLAPAPATHPPLLVLRVDGDPALADAALALPWELIRLEGRFPVEAGRLDLAREAVVDGAPGLSPPTQPLTVVATVAAPAGPGQLDHEEESYRLFRALGEDERCLHFTHWGTLRETARAVRESRPSALHYTGHGAPGALVFEDEQAQADVVEVGKLVEALSGAAALPRLVFLASCHGVGVLAGPTGEGQRQLDPAALDSRARSTAATLHREGFPTVIAYFGPVGDVQSTRAEATVYRRLVRGETARAAVHAARSQASQAHAGEQAHVYPLGWAQLALYLRGDHRLAIATPGRADADDRVEARWDRQIERVDPLGRDPGGLPGVQWLRFGFIGRRRPRATLLRRWFAGERLLVVTGLGGLGKTALCVEIAWRLRDEIPGGVLALDGRAAGLGPDPVLALWRQVAAARQDEGWSKTLAGIQEQGIGPQAVLGAIRALAGEGLLVYLDDAESLQETPEAGAELGRWKREDLRALWAGLRALAAPGGRLTLLASSRYRPEGTPSAAVIDLPPMAPLDLTRMLRWFPTLRRIPGAPPASAGERAGPDPRGWLVARLDGHPRTVEWLEPVLEARLEAVTVRGEALTPQDWLERALLPALPLAEEKIRANLVLPAVLDAVGPEAVALLGRAALLTGPAPLGALRAVEEQEGTLRRLQDAGLISPALPEYGDDDWWGPHRLVVEAVAGRWRGDARAAHARLGAWFLEEAERTSSWIPDEAAIHHLLAAGEADRAWPVARRMALGWRRLGRYREALGLVERMLAGGLTGAARGTALALRVSLALHTGVIPEDASALLAEAQGIAAPENRGFVASVRAALARTRGDLRQAALAQADAVRLDTEHYGQNHAEVAAGLANLAGILQDQGDLAGAREKLELSLQIQARVYRTEEHPSVATSLHALAGVLQAQGDLGGARQMLERSLQIQARVYGTEKHPNVAASLHALAGVLQAQGDLAGAREKLERSLQIQARVYGTEEHPNVAASLHALAGVLQAQGDLAGARETLERCLQIKARVYGTEEHPNVAASLHALAGVLQAQGDLAGATRTYRRVLEIKRSIYQTHDHYSSCITEVNLAQLLLGQGEREEAVALLRHALAVFQRALPPGHPFTRQTAEILASVAP